MKHWLHCPQLLFVARNACASTHIIQSASQVQSRRLTLFQSYDMVQTSLISGGNAEHSAGGAGHTHEWQGVQLHICITAGTMIAACSCEGNHVYVSLQISHTVLIFWRQCHKQSSLIPPLHMNLHGIYQCTYHLQRLYP